MYIVMIPIYRKPRLKLGHFFFIPLSSLPDILGRTFEHINYGSLISCTDLLACRFILLGCILGSTTLQVISTVGPRRP